MDDSDIVHLEPYLCVTVLDLFYNQGNKLF